MRSTKAIIDLQAVQHNLLMIRQLAPDCKIMAVVKADAYGHGIIPVAASLESADAIAVACMDEAVKLRESKIDKPIILLEGFFSREELELAVKLDLQIVIHQQSQLDDLLSYVQPAQQKQLIVWLKLDSGMNRLGFCDEQFVNAYKQLTHCPMVAKINLMSHLANADVISDPMNKQQINLFKGVCRDLKGQKSMANSAAIIAWPESHFDWIRPGIALYGCSPMPGYNGLSHHLLPAMTLQSQLFAIRELKAGDRVGYGATWKAPRATRIGVIAIGYGDGYPRHAAEGTPVWINGRTYPLVGKVSMDMLTVDLGMTDSFSLGDKAILWGKELPVETIAEFAQTIPYTLLCGVTSRVRFEWVG